MDRRPNSKGKKNKQKCLLLKTRVQGLRVAPFSLLCWTLVTDLDCSLTAGEPRPGSASFFGGWGGGWGGGVRFFSKAKMRLLVWASACKALPFSISWPVSSFTHSGRASLGKCPRLAYSNSQGWVAAPPRASHRHVNFLPPCPSIATVLCNRPSPGFSPPGQLEAAAASFPSVSPGHGPREAPREGQPCVFTVQKRRFREQHNRFQNRIKASEAACFLFPLRVPFAGSSRDGGGTEPHARSWLPPGSLTRNPSECPRWNFTEQDQATASSRLRCSAFNLALARACRLRPSHSHACQAPHDLSTSSWVPTDCLPAVGTGCLLYPSQGEISAVDVHRACHPACFADPSRPISACGVPTK